MANVARSVFVHRTSGSAADSVDVLVALGGVLGEVDAGPEHAANVGVSLVEAFLDDRVYERRSVEEHPLVALVVVFLRHFLPPVRVALPQLLVLYFLYLKSVRYLFIYNITQQLENCYFVLGKLLFHRII